MCSELLGAAQSFVYPAGKAVSQWECVSLPSDQQALRL